VTPSPTAGSLLRKHPRAYKWICGYSLPFVWRRSAYFAFDIGQFPLDILPSFSYDSASIGDDLRSWTRTPVRICREPLASGGGISLLAPGGARTRLCPGLSANRKLAIEGPPLGPLVPDRYCEIRFAPVTTVLSRGLRCFGRNTRHSYKRWRPPVRRSTNSETKVCRDRLRTPLPPAPLSGQGRALQVVRHHLAPASGTMGFFRARWAGGAGRF
jgi:hypothetical protein